MPIQARAEETRIRILDAGRVCFSLSGYDATSVSDVCQEAGITKGAFYYHFESKLSLFLELQNQWFSQFDMVLRMSAETRQTGKERLLSLQEFSREIFTGAGNYAPLLFEFWVQSTRIPPVQKKSAESFKRHVDMLNRLIVEGQADGSIKAGDPERTSQMLFGMVMGLIMLALMEPQRTDWGETIYESIKVFIQHLQRNDPSSNQDLPG